MQAPEPRRRGVPTLSEYGRRAADASTGVTSLTRRPLVVARRCSRSCSGSRSLAFALTVRHNGWLFYQGGDQIWLTDDGLAARRTGELAPTYVGYGWPLLLAPITCGRRARASSTAMPPVIGSTCSCSARSLLWAIYGLGARIAGRAFGLLAAAVWVVLPFAVIPLWRDDYHERYVEQFLPGALGLTGLADFQSMVLLLVGALLFMRALETRASLDGVAAGLVVGFAIGVKPSNGLFVAAPIVAALLARNLAAAAAVRRSRSLPALLTLAVWKQRGLGTLPAFALEETRLAAGAVVAGVAGVDRYVDLDWAHLTTTSATCASTSGAHACSSGLRSPAPSRVARRSPPLAACSRPGSASFLVVKGTTVLSTVSSGSFFRFLMPAFPAYFLLAVSILLLVPTLGAAPRGALAGRARTPASTAGS